MTYNMISIGDAFKGAKKIAGIVLVGGTAAIGVALAIPDSNENIVMAQAQKATFSKARIEDKPVFYFNDAATNENAAVLIATSAQYSMPFARTINDRDNVKLLKSSLWNLANE